MSFTIIEDTREKSPWDFSFYDDCNGSVRQKLDEGDYTTQEILRLEEETETKILRIERKKSTGELSMNISGVGWERFQRVLHEMSQYEYKYLIFDFPEWYVNKFPQHSGIPKRMWRRKTKDGKRWIPRWNAGYTAFIRKRLHEMEDDYGLTILYNGSSTESAEKAVHIIREVHNAYKDQI